MADTHRSNPRRQQDTSRCLRERERMEVEDVFVRRFPRITGTRCRAFVISLGLGHLTGDAFRAFWRKEYSNPYPCTYHPYLEPDQTKSNRYGSAKDCHKLWSNNEEAVHGEPRWIKGRQTAVTPLTSAAIQ
ncbi:hypothetical protein DPX16_7269 [Anabarilius grahami]|uniref:Uncharacterized protein n=1 Tax=Anabarilius grahami TaxID=495550 RepID=A0A3N0XN25_ANAGA|nr:hypothetical protein DPX16_7269 [Anabarilius grahami]